MAERNLLLGNGETLTSTSEIPNGSGPKKVPYTIEEVRAFIKGKITKATEDFSLISGDVKPRGEGVFKLTLHPAFLGKSYFPDELIRRSGFRDIGSRQVRMAPRKTTNERDAGKSLATAQIFVAGKESALRSLESIIFDAKTPKYLIKQAIQIEDFDFYKPEDKIKSNSPESDERALFEAVVHAGQREDDILQAFINFSRQHGAEVYPQKRILVGALTFVPLQCSISAMKRIASFTFLRAIRKMPELRVALPNALRKSADFQIQGLPELPPLDSENRVAIFDGGIGASDLSPWVNEFYFQDTEKTDTAYLHHGTEVTSTFLFGRVDKEDPVLGQPYMGVDHYRVISPANTQDVDLFDVLLRIRGVLDEGKYKYINLSLGPRMPIEDDEVHVWTATLDQICAKHGILATIAVGNDGDLMGDNARLQPPSDMVNALAVGAASDYGKKWNRASYSCIGPGRSPGVVKPDGVAFGGTEQNPFFAFNPWVGGVSAVAGTSYAAPLALRTACGAAALTTYPLDAIAIKALLIHHAEGRARIPREEIGWGRFVENPIKLIECENGVATVIYQGLLAKGDYLRAKVPFPDMPIHGAVTLKATLCIQAPTDPEHSINYTRAGMQVSFRPVFGLGDTKTTEFFGRNTQYKTEREYRDDGHKWETCLHREKKFDVETELSDPVFDIRYHARATSRGIPVESVPDMRYAMIISVSVDGMPDLYNMIRQRYQVLQPVALRVDIDLPAA
ncbi:S8 family peptidase [Chromobacterium vaccinii]|uniref:S8 family peptidase n=1 Tax=Chromobacterium vaccinii TaxID=1108595 RepID=UPI0009F2E741|nr:S8 family peptidase [Chromobacterium vaccinii]